MKGIMCGFGLVLVVCTSAYGQLVLQNLDTGTAVTRFSGIRQIVAHRVDSHQYELTEIREGVVIRTLNARNVTAENLTDNFNASPHIDGLPAFADTDNYWDNVNPAMDEIATDLHWGTEMSFDYFLNVHGWLGIDNVGGDINTIAHIGQDWDEAFYLPPPFNFLGYGDGGPIGPNATLDVVAHEYTHAVVRYAAGLAYLGESSVLDEGLADIFSVAVKFYVGLPHLERPWDLAEQLGTYRSMSDPKSQFQPDTYKGEYWYVGPERTIFAHQNNGVITYWFYLISEGGSGTNDHGHTYSVSPMRLDKAATVVFKVMKDDLSALSNFFDFKAATIARAAELYGDDSDESNAVREAWNAVGVSSTVTSAKGMIQSTPTISLLPDQIRISEPNGMLQAANLNLMDMHGRQIEIEPQRRSDVEFSIPTDKVRGGIYLLQYGASRAFVKKIWIRK